MTANLSIIAVPPSHHGVAAAVAEACFDPGDGDGWPPGEILTFLDQPGVQAWLAVQGAGDAALPAGFALCRTVLDETELLLIGVLPAARRQGIGRTLLDAVLQAARAGGVGRLHLEVRHDNTAALGLYESAGFQISGRRSGYYRAQNGRPRDALTLTCAL